MPVLFRGNSEYDRNFLWNQSYRSASFSPNLEQSATDAGLRSDQIGSVNGARITSKKKAWHRLPQVQYCLSWWPESDADSHTLDTDNQTVPDKGSPVMKAHKKLRRTKDSPAKATKKEKGVTGTTNSVKNKQDTVVARSLPKKIRTTHKSLVTRHNLTKSPKLATTQNKSSSMSGSKQNMEAKIASPKKKLKTTSDDQPTDNNSSENQTHSESNIPLKHRAGLLANKPTRKSKARLSEYQRNFAAPIFAMKPSPILSAVDVIHTSSSAIPPHTGMQFQQASEYISKYKSPARNSQQVQSLQSPGSPSLKLKVKDMQKPYFTHHSKKGFKTEYAAQYEANRDFEVGELRKMAEDNKQKHEGTHIDPEHATQVLSPFNKLWEVSTDGGTEASETNATDEKETKADQGSDRENESEEKWSKASQKGSDNIDEMTEVDKCTENEVDSLENGQSEISKSSTVRKLAWDEADGEDLEEISQNSRESASVLEGRVSTPRLQEIGGALRTHHDLTTPSIGGALLISPKSATMQPGSESSCDHERLRPKTAGSPTHDSHSLLKGRMHHLVRSSPQPLPSKRSPSKQVSSPIKTPSSKAATPQNSKPSSQNPKIQRYTRTKSATRAPIRGALRSEEFQHCGRLQTAPALIEHYEDDALSIASSLTSARATELLQRAKQRKSFWTTT